MSDDDEDDEDDDGLSIGEYESGDDPTGEEEIREYTDEELVYITLDGEGELVAHPTVDLESGIAYCSEAPDGILHLLWVGDGEYQIWRTDSAE
jgi:hypothetical protein